MHPEFDLLSIGSGPAGQRAAVQAAKLGKRVAVVERRQVVGGVCVATGTIPSKTFREAVLALTGPGATHRPTAEELLSRVTGVVATEAKIVETQLRRNEIELVRGEASFVDPHTIAVRGSDGGTRTLTAENILIAVGTVAARPPGVEDDGELIVTSDSLTRLRRVPRAMVVVGGGVIGIEYASMFAQLGVEVTLIEKRPALLEFVDREIVDELIHQMRDREVTFRFGETVERLEVTDGSPRRATIHLESGKRLTSDLVLFSVGRQGATASLNLGAVGLEADARGRLRVDDEFRTPVPHVFAAGDVIGFPSLAATSSRQGRLAARFAFGIGGGALPAHYPVGIYSIPEISMVGRTEHELTAERVPYECGVARYREIARGQILGDDSGLLKLLFHREDRSLLGVHVIGTGATELVHIGQAVLALGGGLDYFLDTVFNYPTLAECYKVAALDASNKLTA